jgi:hypothetical protein
MGVFGGCLALTLESCGLNAGEIVQRRAFGLRFRFAQWPGGSVAWVAVECLMSQGCREDGEEGAGVFHGSVFSMGSVSAHPERVCSSEGFPHFRGGTYLDNYAGWHSQNGLEFPRSSLAKSFESAGPSTGPGIKERAVYWFHGVQFAFNSRMICATCSGVRAARIAERRGFMGSVWLELRQRHTALQAGLPLRDPTR